MRFLATIPGFLAALLATPGASGWSGPSYPPPTAGSAWTILKPEWSSDDEVGFSRFVQAIGKSSCESLDQCLRDPSVPGHLEAGQGLHVSADCADFAYELRAFYAWRNHLPFSYTSAVGAGSVGARDLRATPEGNRETSRAESVTLVSGRFPSIFGMLRSISMDVSTATYRIGPGATDLYPVRLTRDAIRPGTVIYDPAGHVMVVYDVDSSGRVLYVDAHPDQSVTRRTYSKSIERGTAAVGAGFRNWRPQHLVGARKDSSGRWIGGHVVPAALNDQLPNFSLEQYAPSFEWKGRAMEFADYLRRALAVGDFRYDPRLEFADRLKDLCNELWDRVESVQVALDAHVDRLPHPQRLPENIYASAASWETYATPARDARLRSDLHDIRTWVETTLASQAAGSDPEMSYDGQDLAAELASIHESESQACGLSYHDSVGNEVELSFDQVEARGFALSFDPYQCAERRWGATSDAELVHCRDTADKRRWYAAEQPLRDRLERDLTLKTGLTLGELEADRTALDRPAEDLSLGNLFRALH